MFAVTLICVGKLKEKFYLAASEEYAKRLRGYVDFTLIELPETRLPDDPSPAQIAQGLAKEAERSARGSQRARGSACSRPRGRSCPRRSWRRRWPP